MRFQRSLTDFLSALAFLCCHYILDSYVTCLTLEYINFWCVSNLEQSLFQLHSNLFQANLDALYRAPPPESPAVGLRPPALFTLATLAFLLIMFAPGIISVLFLMFPAVFYHIHPVHNKTASG